MISQAEAKKHVARLAQMIGYPKGDDQKSAHNELVLAMQNARSEATAKSVIDTTIACATAETRCPMPAELRRMVWDRQDPEDRPTCPECLGEGFLYAWRVRHLKRNAQDQMVAHERAATLDEIRDGEASGKHAVFYQTTVDCSCKKAMVSA